MAVDGYLAHIAVERGLSPNTVAAYRRDLARYTQWCHEHAIDAIDDVDATDIEDFAASVTSAGLAASSAARTVVAVRSLHRFCADEGLTPVDPGSAVSPPAIPKRLPKALPYDDVAALIAATGHDLTTPADLRDRALVEVLYGTGIRISEAVGLDVDDIDLDELTVIVTGKGGKQRLVPLGEVAALAIDAYLVRGRPALATAGRGVPRLFLNTRGAPLSRQSAHLVVSEAAQRAGITTPVSPHTLRHSYATHLLAGGADIRVVQELLGHASVTTTQAYTLVTVDALREVYAASHPRAL